MDQNNLPSGNSQNVDALLNDILQGHSPAVGTGSDTSAAPAVSLPSTPTTPDPVTPPASDIPSSFGQTVAMPVTPSVQNMPEEAPAIGHGMAALKAMEEAPTSAMNPAVAPASPMGTSSVESTSAAPLMPTAPASTLPNSTPTQVMPKYEAASAPASKNKAPLIAGALVVSAVVLGGIGAGLVLTGQDQDVRNQAYVAPSPLAQRAAPTTSASEPDTTSAGFEVMVALTAENSFIANKDTYPSATAQTFSGEGISGQAYVADNSELASKVIFAEIQGLQESPTSVPTAWIEYSDGTTLQAGTVELNESGVGHFVYEDLSGRSASSLVISYENPEQNFDSAATAQPTQKVANAAL